MQSRSLPLTYIDVNSNLFKVTTGIKLSSGNNTYRKSVQSVYILEEYREGVWRHVLCCDIHDKEESRRELVKHICHAYKAKLTDSSDTLRKGQQIDSINAEINDIEEEIERIIREAEAPSSTEEIRRKGAKPKEKKEEGI